MAFVPAHFGIGYVPEGRGMLASLSVRKNLEMRSHPRRRFLLYDTSSV